MSQQENMDGYFFFKSRFSFPSAKLNTQYSLLYVHVCICTRDKGNRYQLKRKGSVGRRKWKREWKINK